MNKTESLVSVAQTLLRLRGQDVTPHRGDIARAISDINAVFGCFDDGTMIAAICELEQRYDSLGHVVVLHGWDYVIA